MVSGRVGRAPRVRYLPIAEHGLIGDLHTVALVGTDGTIDWYCCPRFDSPSVFAAMLDADRGGRFRIAPEHDGWTSKQLYLPDTNVLITRFLMPDGVGEVQDFMPPARNGAAAHRHRLVRRVVAVRGRMRLVVEVAPRFDYARGPTRVAATENGGVADGPNGERMIVAIGGERRLAPHPDGGLVARFRVRADQRVWIVTSWGAPRAEPIVGEVAPHFWQNFHPGLIAAPQEQVAGWLPASRVPQAVQTAQDGSTG